MSCTVVAVPVALSWIITKGIIAGVVTGGVIGSTAMKLNNVAEYTADIADAVNETVDLVELENNNSECDAVHSVTMEHFIEKEFETPFTNEELLLKTLEEHGVKDIQSYDNSISGIVDNYNLNFTKFEGKENYVLKVSSNETCNAEEKVNDLASEYSMNVQEDAYLRILDKLKENNMQIEEENVEDDNTIVITVNLD